MFKAILNWLNIFQCKHKDMTLIGYSYRHYVNHNRYNYSIVKYETETFRHLICNKCNKVIEERIASYISDTIEERDEFHERLRNKGFLRIEDIVIEIDKVRYNKLSITSSIDSNKTL